MAVSQASVPKPYDSWIFVNGAWDPPVPYPTDGKTYHWDESIKNWVEIPE
jgi:hypothetical protein